MTSNNTKSLDIKDNNKITNKYDYYFLYIFIETKKELYKK